MEQKQRLSNETILSTILTVVTTILKSQKAIQSDHIDLKSKLSNIVNEQKENEKLVNNINVVSDITSKQISDISDVLSVLVDNIKNENDVKFDDLHLKLNSKLDEQQRNLKDLVTQIKPINYKEHITKLVESIVILQKNMNSVTQELKVTNSKMDEIINEVQSNKELLTENSSRINSLDLRIASLIENGLTPVTDASLTQLINDLNIDV